MKKLIIIGIGSVLIALAISQVSAAKPVGTCTATDIDGSNVMVSGTAVHDGRVEVAGYHALGSTFADGTASNGAYAVPLHVVVAGEYRIEVSQPRENGKKRDLIAVCAFVR